MQDKFIIKYICKRNTQFLILIENVKGLNILDKIIATKYKEVAQSLQERSQKELESMPLFGRECISLKTNLLRAPKGVGVIAEHKRASPSKGVINKDLTLEEVIQGYTANGAAGISVLTDQEYFGGTLNDLREARSSTHLPLLRKDFIVDAYQLVEAKAFGADVVLLIAAQLTPEHLKELARIAKSLGLEVLMEVHTPEELDKNLIAEVDMVGVNNRNLKTFEVDLNTSIELSEMIPSAYAKISESGIYTAKDISTLKSYGYNGFLIGESFMRTNNPGNALKELLDKTH